MIKQPASVGCGDYAWPWLALFKCAPDLRIAGPLHRNRGVPRDTAEVGQHRQPEQLNPRDERQAPAVKARQGPTALGIDGGEVSVRHGIRASI